MGLNDDINIMSFEQRCFMGASDMRLRQAQKIKNQAMTMATIIPISSVKIKHLRIKLIGYYSQPPLCSQVAQRLDVLKYVDTTNYRWNTESPFPRKALPCRSFRKENISGNSTLMLSSFGALVMNTIDNFALMPCT